MRLTPTELTDLYPTVADYSDIFYNGAGSASEFKTLYLTSKLWRLNNLYTIIDKGGNKIKFDMNYAQHKTYSSMLQHPRLIVLKSRQQGISTLWLISFFDDVIFNGNFNIGLMAQGTDEATKLLERIKILWDNLDPSIKSFMSISNTKNNSKEFSFSNGSAIYVRVSFRSATLQRLHISEFGKIANENPIRAKETKTGTLQAIAPGNPVVIESTAEGNNMFKEMWDSAEDCKGQLAAKDFKPVFLSWLDDPDCVESVQQTVTAKQAEYFSGLEAELNVELTCQQRNFWISQYREIGELIFQEYPATAAEAFQAIRDGTYYNKLYRQHVINCGRELVGLYDSALGVNVMWDLGMNDTMVLVFFQIFENDIRIIDEYTNSGEGLRFYVDLMEELARTKGYKYDEVVLPHDISVKELGTGRKRIDVLYDMGVTNTYVMERTKSVVDDIEIVRQNMHRFSVDPSCSYMIDCFLKYQKEWDERNGVWKKTPKHDEYSHGADCLRGIVLYAPDEDVKKVFRYEEIEGGSGFAL